MSFEILRGFGLGFAFEDRTLYVIVGPFLVSLGRDA
jgi:hypothetical protein